jgi:hypothetical protein
MIGPKCSIPIKKKSMVVRFGSKFVPIVLKKLEWIFKMLLSKVLEPKEESYQDNFNRLDGEFQAYLVQLRKEHTQLLIATAVAEAYLSTNCAADRKARIAAKLCRQGLGVDDEQL